MSSTDKLEGMAFGTVEIPEDAVNGKAKIRITMMVDADVLEGFKLRAAEEHTKYQTLMNRILREGLKSSSGATLEARLAALEQIVCSRKLKPRKRPLAGHGRQKRKIRSTT